jgi:hypothetical protein
MQLPFISPFPLPAPRRAFWIFRPCKRNPFASVYHAQNQTGKAPPFPANLLLGAALLAFPIDLVRAGSNHAIAKTNQRYFQNLVVFSRAGNKSRPYHGIPLK